MRLIAKKKLEKLKRKNKGNTKLSRAIDDLVNEIESSNWKDEHVLKDARPDADCVHSDGFYFFDISVHRTLILIEIDDESEATVVWTGTHQEYETIFKNNKNTIKKWLKAKEYIL